MLDRQFQPTPEFKDMIVATVDSWKAKDDELGNPTEFIVTSIVERNGRVTHWGVLDVKRLPPEDIYIEAERRYYCGYRTVGQENVFGIAFTDMKAVFARVDLPKPPQKP